MADDDTRLLDSDLLTRLEAGWKNHAASIVDHLAPGLTDEEMSEITAPLGLSLPLEARAWWGWHDGVPWRPDGGATPERALGPGLEYMPLRDAVEGYLLDRRIFTEVEGDPEPFRPAAYFPITRSSGPILCDCSVPEGAPTPIYYTHTYESRLETMQRPVAASFGEMVTWWIEALADGSWRWDSARECWDLDLERLDPLRGASGLV